MNELETTLLLVQRSHNWYLIAAILALVLSIEVPRVDVKAIAADDNIIAAWAVRIFKPVAWHVTDVGVVQALLSCHIIMPLQGLDGRGPEFHHLVVRVEPQKVDWRVRPQLVVDEPAELFRLLQVVSHLRHYQVRDFDMDFRFFPSAP